MTKRKGDDFERKVARWLKGAGLDARRIVTGPGAPGDVLCEGWALECKHSKSPSYLPALQQAEGDIAKVHGAIRAAAVVLRHGDSEGPTVTMRFRDFVRLLSNSCSLDDERDPVDCLVGGEP